MARKIVGIILIFLVSATAPGQEAEKPETAKKPAPTASTAVYEAVLRYQVKSWELTADSYCVAVNGKDAGVDLLSRLHPLRVKPASECRRQTRSVTMQVIDKKTKRQSVIFDIDKILWRSETAADVEGGYVCASLCMAEGTYHVVWAEGLNGTWRREQIGAIVREVFAPFLTR